MMIRRFAGDGGLLFELRKENLYISRHGRAPKAILYGWEFYKDETCDLDAQLLTPIEQRFAPYYAKLADGVWSTEERDSGERAAFIDWVCAMLVRTELIVQWAHFETGNCSDLLVPITSQSDHAAWNNNYRIAAFEYWRSLVARPKWRWKCRILPENDDLVISDHPVCNTNGLSPGGMVIFVPLSKQRILIGGLPDAIMSFCSVNGQHLNRFLAAWAHRSIFAASRSTLERVAADLGDHSTLDPVWCARARKPLFGFLEQVRTTAPPTAAQLEEMDRAILQRYGTNYLRSADE